jgi:non-specific protein-tyrosine kinase
MIDLKVYITPLLKWWWLIVVTMALAGGSSYWAVKKQPLTYQTRTTLMIGSAIEDPNPTNSQFTLAQQLAQTYADSAKRQPIRQATMRALGLDWLPEYSVRAESQIIEITVVDTNAQRAQAAANELANQLINLSPSGLDLEEQERLAFVNRQLDQLQLQIEETEAEIEVKQAELGELFSAGQIAETQAAIAALEAKRNNLQTNFSALLSTTQQGAINTLSVVEPASLPLAPIGAQLTTTMATAMAIAFVLTGAAAFFLEYMDDTIKTSLDVSRVARIQTLGSIAKFKKSENESSLVALSRPHSVDSEAFRILRTGIQFAGGNNTKQTLMVTSASPSEGKSTVTANLGVVLAQAGFHVLLVDADLRRPTQHKIFDLVGEVGLTNLLLSSNLTPSADEIMEQADGLVQATFEPRLSLLASGPVPHNPSELLGSQKMRLILTALLQKFDVVILDTSPALAVTDPVVLSTLVDGVVFIVSSGKTRRRYFEQALGRLKEVNANMVGVVLNKIQPNADGYSNYYHAYKSVQVGGQGELVAKRFYDVKRVLE